MTAATARLNMRVREDALERIRAAAELSGTDVTAFVVAAANAEARRVMLQERALRLTSREVDQIADLISEDRDPVAALVDAAQRLEQSESAASAAL